MKLSPLSESKLGFDLIRQYLESKAVSPEGKQYVVEMQPARDREAIRLELLRVKECASLIEAGKEFDGALPFSVSGLLDKSRIGRNWLSGEELARLLKWLRVVRNTLRQLREHQNVAPELCKMATAVDFRASLIPLIEKVVDDQGNIRDNASPELLHIRREQMRVSAELRKVLTKILRQAKAEGWAGDAEVTLRNDRLVIPMKADFRGRVPGFVQDVSQSGQTIFLEPTESLEMNNSLRRLQAQEKNEIVRILTEVTAAVGQEAEPLGHWVWLVGRLDFIHAKAVLAVALDAQMPYLRSGQERGLLLLRARHPLLVLRSKEKVMPLTLELNQQKHILLVSGPNAGGKSVTLKTVGLLALMVQCGMLVPCNEGSEFMLFDHLFVDIGDEQSIQNDLSTYTSHLKTLREMDAELTPDSLFLIDEFGAGTDPRLGGAIAEAFLERFLQRGAFGVITTHYGNLKQFAETHAGIVNAAMRFNPETLSPTYEIDIGVPGRSYAFEIARKVGVEESLIARAREKVDQRELYAEDLLLQLEAQKEQLDGILDDNRKRNEELKSLMEKNRDLSQSLTEKRNKIINEARSHAQNLIQEANARIERTIKEIRETQAEKELTKNLRKELAEMVNLEEAPAPPPELMEAGVVEEEKMVEHPAEGIAERDWVKLKDGDAYGWVESLSGKRAVVVVGQMKLTVNLSSIVKIDKPHQTPVSSAGSAEVVHEKRNKASAEIDVQGMRVEEALLTISKFIDDAQLAGLTELRILHGKGTGALRIAIRDYLRQNYGQVQSLEDAPADFGGAGWTIVKLAY